MQKFAAKKINEHLLAISAYFALAVVFLIELITSQGNAAQADWGIPITVNAAVNQAKSLFYVWSYNGYGGLASGRFGFPVFQLLNGALAPFGFIGGNEIKVVSVVLVASAGIAAYFLARSFGLGFYSAFFSGLFFMSTAVVFDWLMFGWFYYLIGYALLPVMILTVKKFLETNDLRYALLNGAILSIVIQQPTYILVYPLIGLIFIAFEANFNGKLIRRGILLTIITLVISALSALSFLVSYNNTSILSFYQGEYFGNIITQFSNLASATNILRLWGSTFNMQFENYFPVNLAILSYLPVFFAVIAVIAKPRDKRVIFAAVAYLFVLAAFEAEINLRYLVYHLPFGSLWEAPCTFLVPASLGSALLIGYACQVLTAKFAKQRTSRTKITRILSLALIPLVIVSASMPWWTQQTSGTPLIGAPTKLNLYTVPNGYITWNNAVNASSNYFVLYLPQVTGAPDIQIMNSSYFSGPFQGVNFAVFQLTNSLPYVSTTNTTQLVNELVKDNSTQVSETWGSYSIKYIVVYTNALDTYNGTELQGLLAHQSGITEVANLTDVLVYEDEYAKPIVYSLNASTEITSNIPTDYKVQATATTPFTLILNQIYAPGWVATVNGTKITTHTEDSNGFNDWYINEKGHLQIELYYEPQTTYLASMLISIFALIAIVLYLAVATIRLRLKKTKEETAKREEDT